MQGALTVEEFEAGLDAYSPRLIPASEWIDRAVAGKTKDECTVTFDDGLREAYVIAKPALDKRGLTAAWNIYTGPLVGVPNNLERWRWLRNVGFGNVDRFYGQRLITKGRLPFVFPEEYLADRSYLAREDRVFRFWRNEVATPLEYERVMTALEVEAKVKWAPENHWLSIGDIQDLAVAGHIIGFHTHSHPTNMARLSVEQQALEYATSKGMLELVLERRVDTMAHPCSSYTDDGLAWLREHGIRLAWGGTITGTVPWNAPRWSTGEWTV